MIRRALHHGVGLDEPPQRARQIRTRRNENGEVIEARGAAHARCLLALRERQQIGTAGAQPRGPLAASMQRESEVGLVETNGAVQITDGEMNRSDVCRRIDHSSATEGARL